MRLLSGGFAAIAAALAISAMVKAQGAIQEEEDDLYDSIDVADMDGESEASDPMGDPMGGLGGLGSLFGMMGGGADGADGDACVGQFAAPAKPLHQTEALAANGCGPQGMQLNDEYGLEVCCNGHDICYGLCGTDFQQCENTFKKCMKKHCNKNYSGQEKAGCHQSASSFHAITSMMGKGLHNSWQHKLCKCFDTESAAQAHHTEMLTAFYEFLKEKGASVDDPETKAKSNLKKYAGKEGLLYFKL